MQTHRPNSRSRRRLAKLVLGTACAFLAMTAPSMAMKYDGRTGSPGNVTKIYKIQGSHWNSCTNLGYACFTTWLTSTGATVTRSPATSGHQRIEAVYKLYRWNDGWKYQTTSVPRTSLSAGYSSVQLPAYNVLPYPAGAGSWSVYITFRWYNAAGRLLGTRSIDMDSPYDYECATRFPCHLVREGGIYLGRTVGPLYRQQARLAEQVADERDSGSEGSRITEHSADR